MHISTRYLRSFRLGGMCTFASIPRRATSGLGHVPSWHLGIVGLLRSLRWSDQWPTNFHCYKLALPPTTKFHDVFHVSLLKIYVNDVDHVIDWSILQVEQEGELQTESRCILKWKHLILRNRAIEKVKVQWKHFGPEEAMWEMVDQMWALYPLLFVGWSKAVLVWCWYMFGICFANVLVYVCICIWM